MVPAPCKRPGTQVQWVGWQGSPLQCATARPGGHGQQHRGRTATHAGPARYLRQEDRSHEAQLPGTLGALTGQAEAHAGRHLPQDGGAQDLDLLGIRGRAHCGLQQVHARPVQPVGKIPAAVSLLRSPTQSPAPARPGPSHSPPVILGGRDDEKEPLQCVGGLGPRLLCLQQLGDPGAEPAQLLVLELPGQRGGADTTQQASN